MSKDKPWTAGQRTDRDARVYAVYHVHVGRQLGAILALLKELEVDERTVVFLCGDNGGQAYFKTDDRPHGFFGPNFNRETGERFRAGKGSLYEGGLKVPFYARRPGTVAPRSVSDHLLYFPDAMPTLAGIAEADCPGTDGLSFLPTLTGKGEQARHDFLYWEYVGQTAVRQGDWEAYRSKKGGWELYELGKDVEESNDVAGEYPEVLKRLVGIAGEEHDPIRPGEIYDRELVQKDHLQAPHEHNLDALKRH